MTYEHVNELKPNQKENKMGANVCNGIVSGQPNGDFNNLLDIWTNSCESRHTLSRGQGKIEDKLRYEFDTENEPKEPRLCDELERYEDARKIGKLIEEKLREERERNRPEEWELEPIPSRYVRICIDGLLGKYEYDNSNNEGKITLYGIPILKAADDLGIDPFYFSAFVEAHEYAHAKMCPSLNTSLNFYTLFGSSIIQGKIHRNAAYLYIEEGLANAYALKVFENSPYFSKLRSFVLHQASHYRFGLDLYDRYRDKCDLTQWMRWWREFKSRDNDYEAFLRILLS